MSSGASRTGAPGAPRASRSGPASAARPRRTAPRSQPREPEPITLTGRSLILIALIVVALAALVPTLNTYVAQRQELAALETQVSQQQKQVNDLEKDVARWEDPAFVAAQARERLLFAMPGETQYRLADTSGKDVPRTEAEVAASQRAQGDWFSTLWSSVEAANRLTPDDLPDPHDSTTEDADG